ncbi:RidA family protein [Limnobacter sp. CACIAM 66H1]|uniref:RidA family protein n=1 Tax=Limnobacter sp. CACIAM 66H1 TaxID=1813033 RepID=UPI0025BF2837|nr:RidA family protein [Limnobacter sp. CACIAM 66H1]
MIHRQGTTKRYSDSTSFNGVVYLVEVPSMEEGDIQAQTRDLLGSLEGTMAGAGTDKSHLLMVQVYLTNMARDYDGFNAVWEAWLPEGTAPSRACVEAKGLAKPGWKVELVVTAAVNQTLLA